MPRPPHTAALGVVGTRAGANGELGERGAWKKCSADGLPRSPLWSATLFTHGKSPLPEMPFFFCSTSNATVPTLVLVTYLPFFGHQHMNTYTGAACTAGTHRLVPFDTRNVCTYTCVERRIQQYDTFRQQYLQKYVRIAPTAPRIHRYVRTTITAPLILSQKHLYLSRPQRRFFFFFFKSFSPQKTYYTNVSDVPRSLQS